MARLLEKAIPNRDLYEQYHSKRLKEGQLAVDGLYGVMLAIKAKEPVTIFLPALVTGHGPHTLNPRNQFVYLRMLNRENEPRAIHVSITDGVFDAFDTSILVKEQLQRPEIEEGYLLNHPEVTARAAELSKRLAFANRTA